MSNTGTTFPVRQSMPPCLLYPCPVFVSGGGMERRRLEHRSLTATPLLLVLVNLNKNTMQILLEYHRRVAPVSISSNKTEKYLNETLFRSDQTDLAKFSKWWSLILMRSTCLVSLLKSCLVREILKFETKFWGQIFQIRTTVIMVSLVSPAILF